MQPLRPDDPRRIGGYQVRGRLGAGGMGEVFLGCSPAGMPVAIKVIHTDLTRTPQFRTRFAREVEAARSVSGAFTAPVIDADPQAPNPWLVTAFIPGMTLRDAVTDHGPLPVAAVFALGAGLAEALLAVHRAGIVHRDLKPSNVMFGPDGPRLIDFGIARVSGAGPITQAGGVIGTPGYLAPEQAKGEVAGPSSDVFSLGAVLTYAASGEGPFGRGDIPVLIHRAVHGAPRLDYVTDPELRALIETCLHKDPKQRPIPTQIMERLSSRAPDHAMLQGTTWLPRDVRIKIDLRRRTSYQRLLRPNRRRFLLLAGTATVLAAGTGGIAAFIRPDGNDGTAPPTKPLSPAPTTASIVTGRELWRHNTGIVQDTAPVFAEGLVYVNGGEGRLLALDAKTGQQRWSYQRREKIDGEIADWQTPIIVGRTAYAAHDDFLYCLDARSGKVKWRYKTPRDIIPPEIADGVLGGPVVIGQTVYILGATQTLYAIDAGGVLRWERAIPNSFNAVLAALDDVVYVLAGKTLHMLDANTGQTQRRRSLAQQLEDAVMAGDTVWGLDDENRLIALDIRTGKRRWTFQGGAGIGPPTVAGSVVYVADGSDTMNALDASSGATRWRFQTKDETLIQEVAVQTTNYPSKVAVANKIVCFASQTAVFALDITSGRPRWRYHPSHGDAISSNVEARGGGVYFSNGDEYVYALDLNGGA